MSSDPKIQEQIEELKELRTAARTLARSGNPAVRTEGRLALEKIQQDLESLYALQ